MISRFRFWNPIIVEPIEKYEGLIRRVTIFMNQLELIFLITTPFFDGKDLENHKHIYLPNKVQELQHHI